MNFAGYQRFSTLFQRNLLLLKRIFERCILNFAVHYVCEIRHRLHIVSSVLYFSAAILVLGIMTYSSWLAQTRESLISLAGRAYPGIEIQIWQLGNHWVPYPWEHHPNSPDEVIKRIQTRTLSYLQELNRRSTNSSSFARSNFAQFLKLWGTYRNFCKAYIQKNGQINTKCKYEHIMSYTKTWAYTYHKNFVEKFFVSDSGVYPRLEMINSEKYSICNMTPLAASVLSLSAISSRRTAEFAHEILRMEIGQMYLPPAISLKPGSCVSMVNNYFDILRDMNKFWYYSYFENSEEAQWFENIWENYHYPELKDPTFKETLRQASYEQALTNGIVVCGLSRILDRSEWINAEDISCNRNEAGIIFSSNDFLEGGESYGVISYPGLSSPGQFASLDGTGISEDAIEENQKKFVSLGNMVTRQFLLYSKWSKTISKYFLTLNDYDFLKDNNGPLLLGVSASNIPRKTIRREDVEVPSLADITLLISHPWERKGGKVNTRLVYSVYDIFEILEEHGSSADRGIEGNISFVNGPISDAPDIYTTAYRFNVQARQVFDTNISIFTGIKYGLPIIGSSWEEWQQYRYLYQINSDAFEVGEFLSFFAPVGPGVLRFFGRGAKGAAAGARFSRMVASGAIEAALAAGYSYAMAPPLKPEILVREEAQFGALFGFAFGAFFAPK